MTHLTYKQAGVNIEAGNQLVELIKPLAKRTQRPEVLGSLGGFAGLCRLPTGLSEPILVSSTDGVGTKLKLAIDLDRYDTIGIDLVAMCVNDIIVTGAEPLFFLDYYACGHLNVTQAEAVIRGISEGCLQAECTLIGGETAEMPGMYSHHDFDLAGFSVGVVEKAALLPSSHLQPGDLLIAVSSSGVHSNGYSLVRKVLSLNQIPLSLPFEKSTLGETLLTPTKIYVKTVKALLKQHSILAIAHITGGGIPENLPRILPPNTKALIQESTWKWPSLFQWLQTEGHITDEQMRLTFNCGVGLVLGVPKAEASSILDTLTRLGESAWVIGSIAFSEQEQPHVDYII